MTTDCSTLLTEPAPLLSTARRAAIHSVPPVVAPAQGRFPERSRGTVRAPSARSIRDGALLLRVRERAEGRARAALSA